MLIPFGVLSAAGAGGGAVAGSYEHIANATFNGSSSYVEFTNLSQYSSTYKHLELRYVVRSNRASQSLDSFVMKFTFADGNHAIHALYGNGSNVLSGASANSPFIDLGTIPASTFTSNAFSTGVITILDAYSTTKNKTTRSLVGKTGTFNEVGLFSGLYYGSTAATDYLIFGSATGSVINSSSRLSLYGIKG